MDLFDMFGVQDVPAPAKKTKAAKTAKGKEGAAKKEKAVSCPISVITDFGEVAIGQGKMTEKELLELLAERFSLPAEKCVLQKKGTLWLFSVNRQQVAAKGVAEIGPETALYVGNRQQVDASGLVTSDKAESVSFGRIGTYLADTVSPLYSRVTAFSSGEGEVTVIPAVILKERNQEELAKMTFPFKIGTPDGVVREIEEDYYETTLKEAGKTFEGPLVLEAEDMEKFIEKEYPHFQCQASFNACSDKNAVLVFVDAKEKRSSAKTDGKKEELIPTDSTISLIFTKIPLSPDMFGGKESVKKEEIIKLLGTMYPEYSPERTTIEYDKKLKLIIPVLKGAKKGAEFNPVLPFEKWEEWKDGKEYHLFQTEKDGVMYQAEITPVSSTLAPMSCQSRYPGEFVWKIPEIPRAVFLAVRKFFSWVYESYGTEVLIRIWYHQNGFLVTLPEQLVTDSFVDAAFSDEEEVPEGAVLVADIHSHGFYEAFFSMVDDVDEKGNRLYGVMGDFRGESKSFCLRAGTRGFFVPLVFSDVIGGELSEEDKREVSRITERLQERAKHCLKKGE